MIDRGRWFFPNIKSDDYGKDKPSAFQGYRHEVLDSLVAAYKLVQQLDYLSKSKDRRLHDAIVEQKKIFVSHIQQVLDPQISQREFDKITGHPSVGR